jgi:hypothetical protein
MGNSKSVKLSPEIEARIAKVAGMTLLEVRTLALSVMDELTAESIAATDADAIQRAIDRRIKAHQCGRASRQQIERRVLPLKSK